jgi:hypothetical protein
MAEADEGDWSDATAPRPPRPALIPSLNSVLQPVQLTSNTPAIDNRAIFFIRSLLVLV